MLKIQPNKTVRNQEKEKMQRKWTDVEKKKKKKKTTDFLFIGTFLLLMRDV